MTGNTLFMIILIHYTFQGKPTRVFYFLILLQIVRNKQSLG